MNGNGITPTVELATNNGNNGFYPYPIYPMMNGGMGGNGGFWGGEGIWIILIIALLGGFGNNGNGGFFGGNNSFDDGYAWLSNGQKEIMTNTNNGFDTLHLSNQLEGTRDGINALSNQLCNCCADINGNISNGFYNAEIGASNRQMANMQQAFATQTAITGAISNLSSDLASCCCEKRLATCQTQNIVQNEGNATRFADANNTRDIITNATANTQAILDKLCQLELDGKNDTIAQLRQELLYARGQASQVEQTATLRLGQEREVDALYDRLSNCPVPTVPVYGRQPIFTCPNNNNGCGCNNNSYLY